jgi:hypothetical protein
VGDTKMRVPSKVWRAAANASAVIRSILLQVTAASLAHREQCRAPFVVLVRRCLLGATVQRSSVCRLAGGWLGSAREAWLSTGQMHEKLNALRRGAVGAGGEYTPQVNAHVLYSAWLSMCRIWTELQHC